MNAVELLDELGSRGITVTADGDRLKVDAPKGTLTDDLRAELKRHKTALLALLVVPPASTESPDPKWAQAWAEAMIAAGMPRYADGRTDTGADGWRLWLAEAMGEVQR